MQFVLLHSALQANTNVYQWKIRTDLRSLSFTFTL